jgi:hypothetical protein
VTRTPPGRAGHRRTPALAGLLLAALLPAACSTSPGATATPVPPTARPTAAVTDGPEPTVDETQVVPGQSDSAWGRIWNAVPDSFPVPIDAAEADPAHGPVSGAWTVPVADVSAPDLVRFYRDAIDELGWAPIIDGPLEDGSYTVYTTDAYGCETLTTILPRGDESLVTVLFGAGCPFR